MTAKQKKDLQVLMKKTSPMFRKFTKETYAFDCGMVNLYRNLLKTEKSPTAIKNYREGIILFQGLIEENKNSIEVRG